MTNIHTLNGRKIRMTGAGPHDLLMKGLAATSAEQTVIELLQCVTRQEACPECGTYISPLKACVEEVYELETPGKNTFACPACQTRLLLDGAPQWRWCVAQ